jgi:hypothetical protein
LSGAARILAQFPWSRSGHRAPHHLSGSPRNLPPSEEACLSTVESLTSRSRLRLVKIAQSIGSSSIFCFISNACRFLIVKDNVKQ